MTEEGPKGKPRLTREDDRRVMRAMATRHDWVEKAKGLSDEIGECAAAHDADDSFVSEGFDALKREGFFAALVPEELGGSGASVTELGHAIRIIAAACSSTGLAFTMHSHVTALAAWRHRQGQPGLEGLLRKVAGGAILLSSGGSDWLPSGGKAERVEGGYRVTARKGFSSGTPAGTILATSAVIADESEEPTVIHFPVPLDAEGVTVEETWRVMGMRGTGSHDIVLDNVFVPDSVVTARRPKGKWHPFFDSISMIAFPMIYAAYVGVAEGARDKALELAKGRPADPGLIATIGQMENTLLTARTLHERMLWLADNASPGPDTTKESLALRTLVGDAAIATVEKAMLVAGGAAFYRSKGLERAFRDVQAARFHPLQLPAQLDFSGRMALGLDLDG
jgi:acyl-CoA dehydrogenase